MSNPHQVTKDFEAALCSYTGSKYAVTTTSCTLALTIALAWYRHKIKRWHQSTAVQMPKLSYVGVPAAILNAGLKVSFRDELWEGWYQIRPTPVVDSARRFTRGMYHAGTMQCVSFHVSKILADTQGGAILHDNDEADAWMRRARFDGRTEGADPKTDQVQYPSWHAYMSPDVAARLLWKLSVMPDHNFDLPRSDYPDLSTLEAFK